MAEKIKHPITIPGETRMPPVTRASPQALLLLAVWFGLVAGLTEVALLALRKLVLHRMVFLSPHAVWMAPLADLCALAIPGLAMFLAARWWPKRVSLRSATFTFAFVGILPALCMYGPLHHYAALLLAAGFATQVSRLIAARAEAFYSLVRRTTAAMALLVLGLAVGVSGWQALAERHALAALPPAPAHAPNVLLIVLDTLRAQNLSLYGYARPTTPQLERFATRGVRFERALVPGSWTLPSHASMFTGRLPHELSVGWLAPLDATYPTLAEVLRAHGYVTAGFVANVDYCGYQTGLQRGFAHYEDYRVSLGEIILSSSLTSTIANRPWARRLVGNYDILGRKTAAEVNRDFLRWLAERRDQRPFFVFLNYYDAHEPYLPPQPFDTMFGPNVPRRSLFIQHWNHLGKRLQKGQLHPDDINAEMAAYDGAIAYLDQQLGRLLAELETRDLLQNTLVIITSDHGEQFGEHGLFNHGNSLYMPVLHVPLLVSLPARVPMGRSVAAPVSLGDLPATVIDLAGLADVARFPGRSLARSWETGRLADPPAEALLSELTGATRLPGKRWKGATASLVTADTHYIKNGDGREELYDLKHDPTEEHDLTHSEEGRRLLEQFRGRLETATHAPRSN